jgi:stearoyl-CoA desaturase (delta-9 desaturase)
MAIPFLKRALQEPSYGWARDGELYVPTTGEIRREWLKRMNVFASRKAWLSVTVWGFMLLLFPFGVVFLTKYFSWKLMLAGFLYSMVWIGTQGTVYLHRFGTHHAFTFRNRYYRFIVRNLSLKIVPEEVYVVSHHVHHAYSDLPGDPYNAAPAGGIASWRATCTSVSTRICPSRTMRASRGSSGTSACV